MRARFIGDPRERDGTLPVSRPAEDAWFDVPDSDADRYRGNSHYETDEGGEPDVPKPKRKTLKLDLAEAGDGE